MRRAAAVLIALAVSAPGAPRAQQETAAQRSVRELREGDARTRDRAALRLLFLADPGAAEDLRAVAENRSLGVASDWAILAYRRGRAEEIEAYQEGPLVSPDRMVRVAAMELLGRWTSPRAVSGVLSEAPPAAPELARGLYKFLARNPDASVSESLFQPDAFKDVEVRTLLRRAFARRTRVMAVADLSDPWERGEETVRGHQRAAESEGEGALGERAASHVLADLSDPWERGAEMVRAYRQPLEEREGPETFATLAVLPTKYSHPWTDALHRILREDARARGWTVKRERYVYEGARDPFVLWARLRTLWADPEDTPAEAVAAALAHPDALVRQAALLALAGIEGPKATEVCKKALAEPDLETRGVAALVLARRGEGAEDAIAAWSDEWAFRVRGLPALGLAGGETAWRFMEGKLPVAERDFIYARHMVPGLEALRHGAALAAIARTATAPSVRAEALEALARVRLPEGPAAALAAIASEREAMVRLAAAAALFHLKGAAAADAVAAAAERAEGEEKRRLREAEAGLRELARRLG